MERQKIEDGVKDVLREQLGMESAAISLDAHFFDDLGGDSLDYAEAAMELEDKFAITIPEDDQPKRIGGIVDLVERCLQATVGENA